MQFVVKAFGRLRSALTYVKGRDRAVLLRCLSTTLGSGVGLLRSLEVLTEQSGSLPIAQACQGLSRSVRSGHTLSSAMGRYPWVFPDLHRRLVVVGESTGSMVQVLEQLSRYEERQVTMNLRIRSALTMPALVFVLCLTMAIWIPPLLFQGLFEMLQESHVALPWPTQILIAISSGLRSWQFYLLAFLVLAVALPLLWRALDRPTLRIRAMRVAFQLPVLSNNLRLIAVTRFLHCLATSVHVGLPIMNSIQLAADAADNPVLDELICLALEGLREGEEIHQALQRTEFFPLTVIHSTQVGEQSGKLTEMLESLARLYDGELDSSFEALTRALEPLILCIIGSIVGFTVLATMLPITALIQQL